MSKEHLKSFEKGQSGNPNGRPKGVRNRSTILKELLDLNDNELKMHMAQINKAIDNQDTLAYKAVLDSAYGMPQQQTEVNATVTNKEFKPIEFVKTKDGKDK